MEVEGRAWRRAAKEEWAATALRVLLWLRRVEERVEAGLLPLPM